MSPTIIAVVGITGRLGQHLTKALLEKPDVVVHGIARNASKVPNEIASNSRVKIFETDASAQSIDKIRSAIRGSSAVVCCYMGDNSLLIDGQKVLIDAAIAEKVPRYLASDFSFDYRGLKPDEIPTKDFQMIIEEYLNEKAAAGLIQPVHILNGAFTEVMFAPFIGVYDEPGKAFKVWGTGDDKFDMTTYEDTARFTAEVALDPTATGHLKIVGDRLSVKEIQAIYNQVYGEEFEIRNLGSLQDLIDMATAKRAKEPQALFNWLGDLLYYYCVNGATHIEGNNCERYGLEVTRLKRFLEATKQSQLTKLMGF